MFESPAAADVYDLTYSPASSGAASRDRGIGSPRPEGGAAPRTGSRTPAGSDGLASPGALSVSVSSLERLASESEAESTPAASHPREGKDNGYESGGDLNDHSVIEIGDGDKSFSASDEDASRWSTSLWPRASRRASRRSWCRVKHFTTSG